MKRILFTHGHLIVDGNREYEDGALLVNDEIIEDVFINSNHLKGDLGEHEEIDLKGNIVMPGFFDTHTHGAFDVSYNNATSAEMNDVSRKLLSKGTCSFLATLTNNESLCEQMNTLDDLKTEGARFLGIHLEGPFISPLYKGAISGEYILEADEDKLRSILVSSKLIRQMTVAPELEGAENVIKVLKDEGVRVMLGHSAAQAEDAKDLEYDGFTHLFNAEKPFSHRDLSLVNLAFEKGDKYTEIIADGIHIDKSVLKLIYKNIRKDRLILISDSVSPAGLKDGECVFEGERCIKEGKKCLRVKDGRLAGSASFMIDGVKTMFEIGASLTDILLMSSLNAYRLYGLDKRFGSLEKGKYADVVVLNGNLDLIYIYGRGNMSDA